MKKEKGLGFIFFSIFISACLCIVLELLYTQLLNLKAWNHVVYTVIPFAMLGSGIGANGVFVFNRFLRKYETRQVIAYSLLMAAVSAWGTAYILKGLPLNLSFIATMFVSLKSTGMLLMAYSIFMLPFVPIGFLITYLFMNHSNDCCRLYFYDLAGAGVGAALFYFLINHLAVFHSLALIAFVIFLAVVYQLNTNRKWGYGILSCLMFFFVFQLPEPGNFAVDSMKGWEWIPGNYQPEDYDHVYSRWHSLGRTDIFRIKSARAREDMSQGAFVINVEPRPEFCYFTTNFLAGSPVYELRPVGLMKNRSELKPFSIFMEAPYLLLKNPRVLVIGAGGGRDLFMAGVHGARDILGAEINPAIVREMSPGGVLYDYSGRVYTAPHTKVFNIDGRHLVKTLPAGSRDLVILNGVDTFSGLSSGAYAYAESYLYTKEAVEDYLNVLDDGGILNIYRYSFLPELPREELRLFLIILEAVKKIDPQHPEEHIIVGWNGMSSVFVKKTRFTPEERDSINKYLQEHETGMVYPVDQKLTPFLPKNAALFDLFVSFDKKKALQAAVNAYPYDISAATDDKPFFYKFYKWRSLNIFRPQIWHHTGNIVFLTQVLIFAQALIFICLFIFSPLMFRYAKVTHLRRQTLIAFILYVACLGMGYMLVEISAMQRFVLLLGSPIYSIGVVLMALLFSSGLGSLIMSRLLKDKRDTGKYLSINLLFLMVYLVAIIYFYPFLVEALIGFPFFARVLFVILMVIPLGMVLGVFFPAVLSILGRDNEQMIAWAWGINCGFSVMGSILAIIIAQFLGFNMVMAIAGVLYVVAFFLIRLLLKDDFFTEVVRQI